MKDLEIYLLNKVLPKYCNYDSAHNEEHIKSVVSNSFEIAKEYDVDLKMIYTIAIYHDLGLKYGRDDHHLTSAKELLSDENLLEWFNEEQLEIMARAIEDHRASNDYRPRSIYGLIISEADRCLDADTVISRTVAYGLTKYNNLSKQEHYDRVRHHLVDKYGENGYLKLWLKTSLNERRLLALRTIINNDEELRLKFNYYYEMGGR